MVQPRSSLLVGVYAAVSHDDGAWSPPATAARHRINDTTRSDTSSRATNIVTTTAATARPRVAAPLKASTAGHAAIGVLSSCMFILSTATTTLFV